MKHLNSVISKLIYTFRIDNFHVNLYNFTQDQDEILYKITYNITPIVTKQEEEIHNQVHELLVRPCKNYTMGIFRIK